MAASFLYIQLPYRNQSALCVAPRPFRQRQHGRAPAIKPALTAMPPPVLSLLAAAVE